MILIKIQKIIQLKNKIVLINLNRSISKKMKLFLKSNKNS